MGTRTTAGEEMFARYAYPPNALGYCGPGDGHDLLDYADGQPSTLDVSERARTFDGAWPYLELLAGVAGVSPLDPRVVEAYWVGNDLLSAVPPAEFARAVRAAFGRQLGADWSALAATPAPLAHHGFHVFAIYPWTGLLRRTGAAQALAVLDRCRIRWGAVIDIDADRVVVSSRPLTWDGSTLALGPDRPETARLSASGRSLAGGVQVGDQVSLHWNWVCERLLPDQVGTLRDQTIRQLAITNDVTAGRSPRAAARPSAGSAHRVP